MASCQTVSGPMAPSKCTWISTLGINFSRLSRRGSIWAFVSPGEPNHTPNSPCKRHASKHNALPYKLTTRKCTNHRGLHRQRIEAKIRPRRYLREVHFPACSRTNPAHRLFVENSGGVSQSQWSGSDQQISRSRSLRRDAPMALLSESCHCDIFSIVKGGFSPASTRSVKATPSNYLHEQLDGHR